MSTRKAIPENELAEYQRWEPASLDGHVATRAPTAGEIERIHQQAYQEGYESGLSEGKVAGYVQGKALAQAEAARLHALMVVVQEALQQLEQEIGLELLALALDLSKQMLHQALKVKPELLLPIIRDVMDSIPQSMQHPLLCLHPEDAAMVRSLLQAEIAHAGWKVVDDQRIQRGGCRIETPVSEIDATLPTRWQQLAAALGKNANWLDE